MTNSISPSNITLNGVLTEIDEKVHEFRYEKSSGEICYFFINEEETGIRDGNMYINDIQSRTIIQEGWNNFNSQQGSNFEIDDSLRFYCNVSLKCNFNLEFISIKRL